jgi:hypothetical protein
MNDPVYDIGPVALAYELHGYSDAFADLPPWDRPTSFQSDYFFTFDYMYTSIGCLKDPYVGSIEDWEGLSDHRPIFATLDLDCFLNKA